MKIPVEFIKALEAGMCCYPWQVDYVPFLVGGWGTAANGEWWWCAPWPEAQQHYHPFPKDARVVEYPGNNFQVVDSVDNLLAVFVPLADCEIDVSAARETFSRYRASLTA